MTEAHDLTRALGGTWRHRYGTAPCPICQPERRKGQNALTLTDGRQGRLLAHCKKADCGFTDILAAAGVRGGPKPMRAAADDARRDTDRWAELAKKEGQAERVWQEAGPIGGSFAETYLRGRGITCDLPPSLRFHPACWHGATARRYPALIARIDGGDSFAVHRTYLAPDGAEKAAVAPAKAMLGAVAGGAVRLIEGQGPLVVAEGIETALSLASGLLGRPATVWAALSTSGLRGLRLPPGTGRLTIAADGDQGGRAAAHALAERAHALGWTVSLLPAPQGRDWNDILMLKEARP